MGRYRLEGRLGDGSSGTVHLGRTPGGRPAAVKVLRQTPSWDPQAVERFQREAETPQNVILSPTGPRLIDFGIAQAATQNRLTETGITIGTPHYTAPELFDDVELTAAVDILALGATIAYAASGRHPYGNGTMASIIKRMLFEKVDLDGLDPNLAGLLKSCVAADPGQRPSIDQIIEICRRGPSGNTVPVAAAPAVVRSIEAPPTTVRPVETPPGRRRVFWLWPALAGLALLVGGGVVVAQRPRRPGQALHPSSGHGPDSSRTARANARTTGPPTPPTATGCNGFRATAARLRSGRLAPTAGWRCRANA